MGLNRKLTHVVKDRVVQSFQLNSSELLISFADGSTMKVKIVKSNSPPLREGAQIRQILEDQAKFVIECDDDSVIDLTLANPGSSGGSSRQDKPSRVSRVDFDSAVERKVETTDPCDMRRELARAGGAHSYDPDEQASSIVAEIISLDSAILALTTGRPPNPPWARLSPVPAFVEELRILIRNLATPTDDRVPPFLRIVDADLHWRHYLFWRQRPEVRVETMSWYWRFLLMMTFLRQLTWTCKFKESGLSTI